MALTSGSLRQKIVVIGAGPVGALAALYAARRGYDVEVYELRDGTLFPVLCFIQITDPDFVFSYHWSLQKSPLL